MFKDLLVLTKPGIIFGNLIAAVSGFLLASRGDVDFILLLLMTLGTTFVIGSGCVFNNYIDRDIDQKMERTKNRPLAQGRLDVRIALIFGAILGVLGFFILYSINLTALFFGGFGFLVYVGFYSLGFKRSSVYGTLIGSLSGACPPVIGYVSITGTFDTAAAIILMTYCFWQMPHSYAIAIFRYSDYKAAHIPVLPVEKGIKAARFHMYVYIMGFAVAALLLAERGYVGLVYATVIGLMSLYWLYLVKKGSALKDQSEEQIKWGRQLFGFSILMIMVFSVLISVDYR